MVIILDAMHCDARIMVIKLGISNCCDEKGVPCFNVLFSE